MNQDTNITVIKVTDPEQLPILFDIRYEVFVKGQNVSPEEEHDQYEETSVHYLAAYDGTVCGTARWRYTLEGIKLERFAVLEEFRGKGVGKALIARVLKDIARDKNSTGKTLYMHAQTHVVPLYEKFGFITKGNEFLECNMPHFRMELS